MKLEELSKGALVTGIEPDVAVRVIGTEQAGPDALTVYFRTTDGTLKERLLLRHDEPNLAAAEPAERPWTLAAPGEDFRLALEAYRIKLAHLFDPMMAVHSANVEPLPHQITAVYETMLPRQPLRFVLADDPGAGKTIMAGLYIRELMMRADVERVLIVAPGSLIVQWQDELLDKFDLPFAIFSRDMLQQSRTTNPFQDHPRLLARLDQLARSEMLQDRLAMAHWDLVVVDEAHKLSASFYGNELKKTNRFKVGELLRDITRHFLLMTATPHNGKDGDFQLFLSLLDADRFCGRPREPIKAEDITDLMRRMMKEDLLRFDGTPLFPERRAHTITYALSDQEYALYEAVTDYVKTQFNKADRLDDPNRKGRVGFALTILQRRLASSPAAIHHSLERRHQRLAARLEDMATGGTATAPDLVHDVPENIWESPDDLGANEYETFEEEIVDQATAARTRKELQDELAILQALTAQAGLVVQGGEDRKWDELSALLQDAPQMHDAAGRQHKLIVFTEHRDTLDYLTGRIGTLLGDPRAVVQIHGGIPHDERRAIQERFRHDPVVRILLATDAAGEGVNLQNAHLMINYDLPWNPNRLEQRFGRIHRIGQTEVCHLWNMVADRTREGDVFRCLFEKLERERQALGGRVFDILGAVFEDKSLKDLLIEAIRYGDDPAVRARLYQKVSGVLDTEHLEAIINRNALCHEVMDERRLFAIKEEMERAAARRLQPFFVRAFFTKAFETLGGTLRPRESGRHEIRHVPAEIRERDRRLAALRGHGHHAAPVLSRYERICFDKSHIRLADQPEAPPATLLHPGHPLLQATGSLILERFGATLQQGTILMDPADETATPWLLMLLEHSITEGADPGRIVSRRLQFVAIDEHGQASNAGWAPHLDLEPLAQGECPLVQDILQAPWLTENLAHRALAHAASHLVPAHDQEVRGQRERQADRILQAVHERLVTEISLQNRRYAELKEAAGAGKDTRLAAEQVSRLIDELRARLQSRTQELRAMRHVASMPPVLKGAALVIPAGLLATRRGVPDVAPTWAAEAASRAEVERLAMQAVMATERALGCEVTDVSAQQCGWDITSQPPARDGKLPPSRHIEVKGRAMGQTTITVTRNEILCAMNQAEQFILAIVLVDGQATTGPYYLTRPFTQEPDWATTSVNLDLGMLLTRAASPSAPA